MSHENVLVSEAVGPYSLRTNTAAELAMLMAEPEINLSEADRQVAADYAHGLMAGQWGTVRCNALNPKTGEPLSYGEVDKIATVTNNNTFYFEQLRADESKGLRQQLGIDAADETTWFSTISKQIAEGTSFDLKGLRKVALAAKKRQSYQLEQALTRPTSEDAAYVEPASFTVNFTPEPLLKKAEAWQSYRQYYRQLRTVLKDQPGTPLKEAQQALLTVHIGAVNAKMAILYPHLIEFKRQIEAGNVTYAAGPWAARLADATPVFNSASRAELPYPRPMEAYVRFLTRLDHIRRGVAVQTDGKIGPISPDLLKLSKKNAPKSRNLAAVFTDEELQLMKTVRWNSSQFKTFLEDVLRSVNLLSSDQSDGDDVKTRSGRAPDGLWQVVRTPDADSLRVTDKKGTLDVPEELQKAADPTRPVDKLLASAAHEVGHVIQGEEKQRQGKLLPLAEVGGRRYLTVAEAGGIYEERIMRGYQGEIRDINWYYLRGVQAKQAGANRLEVARAIYDTMRAKNPTDDAGEQIHKAVNALERLYRYGGINSQPLDYSLQELITNGVQKYGPKAAKAIALGASSFALIDSATLHRVGMYDLPNPDDIPSSAEVVLKVFKKSYLPIL